MEKTKLKGLTSVDIKYIAILAMLLDHVAWTFIPIDTPLAQIMHFFGRITAPVMCFFISEGYHHTHNFGKYMLRMCIFAVISHFAYSYYSTGELLSSGKSSMITTLALCLLSVKILNSEKLNNGFKLVIILLICLAADECDWGRNAVMFTLAFELARGNRKSQIIAYSATAFVCRIIPLFRVAVNSPDLFRQQIYNFGVFLPALLLLAYNGKRGGGKHQKWVFYIFYPAHLLFIGYLSANY